MKPTSFFIEEYDHTQIKQLEEHQGPASPPILQASTTSEDSLPAFSNERIEEHTKSLLDLHEVTDKLDNLILFCLFTDCEPIHFEKFLQVEK